MFNLKNLKIGKTIILILLIIYAIIQIFPLFWLILFSLKDNTQIFGSNVLGLPNPWIFENYIIAIKNAKVGTYLFNSVIVTGTTIVLTLVISTMASYAIARLRWKLNNVFLLFITTGMMIPVHASLLPLFLNFSKVGILNTRLSLILPYVGFAIPLATNVLTISFKTIPVELEEAAIIDGCNIYQAFYKIMVPMVKPALITAAIFTYLASWNELMFANTFINNANLKTLTVGILSMVGEYSTSWGPIGAGLVVTTIPSVIGYMLVSKRLPDAMSAGAVKG